MKICFYEVKDYEAEFIKSCAKQYGYESVIIIDPLSESNVSLCRGCDAVSTLGFSRADGKIMDALGSYGVKYFSTRTVGFEHVAAGAAKENGITVLHADYTSTNVADFTVMLILMLIRKCKVTVIRSLANNFSHDETMGRDLKNMTVGIIGTGRIGTNVIKNLSGFGCRIICNDKYKNKEAEKLATYVSVDELYSESDVISLHMPLTEENYHMIDGAAISKMKKGVLIINTARGPLIDTAALIRGIESEQIGGAGLDTVEGEEGICHTDLKTKISNKHNIFYLKQFPNVMYTPHVGFYTQEAVYQMIESAFEGIRLSESGTENRFEVK